MGVKDIVRWNVRVSLLYALGIWTMLGSYGFFEIKRKREKTSGTTSLLSAPLPPEPTCTEELREDLQTNTVPGGEAMKNTIATAITMKKDYKPLSSQIYRYIWGCSGKPGEESNSGK